MRKIVSVLIALSLLAALLVAMAIPAAAHSINGIDRVSWLADDFKGHAATLTIKEDGDFRNDFRDGDHFRLSLRPGVKWLRDGSTYLASDYPTINGAPQLEINIVSDTTMDVTISSAAGVTNNNSVDIMYIPLYVDLNGVTGDIYLLIDPLDSAVSANIGSGYNFSTVYNGTNSTGKQPVITETGARGWNDISDTVMKAASGSEYTVKLNGDNIIPASFYNAIRNKDVTVVFELNSAFKLELNGKDVTSSGAKETNIDLKPDTNKIHKDMLNGYSGVAGTRQFTVFNPGSDDIFFTVQFSLDKDYSKQKATLFRKDGDSLELIGSATVDSKGRSDFRMKLIAGDYIALIGEHEFKLGTEPDVPDKPAAPPAVEPGQPSWANPYSDLSATDWYYDAVKYVHQNGIFTGTSDNLFSPNQTLTRGMLVTSLWRLAGQPVGENNSFTDVPGGEWFTEAVSWAAANGIVEGYGNGVFDPYASVNREQMAAIFYRYAGHIGLNLTINGAGGTAAAYADWPAVSSWAQDAFTWFCAKEIIQGKTTEAGVILDPQGLATRAEAASAFMRFAE